MKQVARLHGLRFMWLFLLFAVQLLSACGSKSQLGGSKSRLDGTYATAGDGIPKMSLTFKPNGKVTWSGEGMEIEDDYTVDGNKVKLTNAQAPTVTQVYTLLDDGSIQDPTGYAKYYKADRKGSGSH
jgi:hypothetical protein